MHFVSSLKFPESSIIVCVISQQIWFSEFPLYPLDRGDHVTLHRRHFEAEASCRLFDHLVAKSLYFNQKTNDLINMLEKKIPNPSQLDYPPALDINLVTGETLKICGNTFAAGTVDGLQPSVLKTVATKKSAAMHINNAVSHDWCDYVTKQFTAHHSTKKEGVTPPIYSLGTHLYSCPKGESYASYFRDIEMYNQAIEDILPNGLDPIVVFLQKACALNGISFEYLKQNDLSVRHGAIRLWGKDSGSSSDGRCYFAVPHEDYEETNDHHPLPQIYQSNNVFSIVLCIDAIEGKEPETIIWNRRMSLQEIRDPNNKHPWASYGYRESLFEGVDAMLIRLKKGDAAIIPAHNVHAVVGYPGFQRCTYMAFFHLIESSPGNYSKMIFRT